MKSLGISTLGCSKNTVDSEHILSLAEGHYRILSEEEAGRADILLINTCGFIGDAKEESIEAILSAVSSRRRGQKIGVFGCLSQRYSSELKTEIPEVDAWFGARSYDDLLHWLGLEGCAQEHTGRHLPALHHYACLKISEGCDRRCAYCAIPGIRGGHRSRSIESLVEETRCLAEQGVKELIIIAQDITLYGLDLYQRRALGSLLEALCQVEGIEWIRLHYSYPSSFPEDVIGMMASNPKICPYLDIPLQHISDKVLGMMRRGCSEAETRSLIEKFRSMVPGIALRTTMIVGHPGEGEAEFEQLLDFVRLARFERLGAFVYSEEEGTYGAEHYADEVPEDIKQERLDRLMALQGQISLECNQARVGTHERVIVDGFSDGYLVCRSAKESPDVDGEIFVSFNLPEPKSMVGTFIDVRIIRADEYDLYAEII